MIYKPLKNTFHLKLLEFKYRKVIHYALLVSIVIIQLLLVVMLYNETVNESKLENFGKKLNSTSKAKTLGKATRLDFIDAQKDFDEYLRTNDIRFLEQYYSHLKIMRYHIDSLRKYSKAKDEFSKDLNIQGLFQSTFSGLAIKIDTLNRTVMQNQQIRQELLKLRRLDYRDVLKSIKVDSKLAVDRVGRKGLLSRLTVGIQDRMSVQKEKLSVTAKMKYGKDISARTPKEQGTDIFKRNDEYYQKEFSNFKDEIVALKINNLKFISAYESLLVDIEDLLDEFNRTIDLLETKAQSDFNRQYADNKRIRNYTTLGLVLFMIVVSVVLIFFTRLTFEYEERLKSAQKKIVKDLSFKNRIVGMISHEIRSPLNIISIYCNVIGKQLKDDYLKESLKSIQFTANSLSLLASQVLKFSNDEGKKLKLNKVPFKLEEELVQILKGLEALVENSGNHFKLKIMNVSKDIIVHSDEIKIQELFYNIVGNANKFTNNGCIEVSINCIEVSNRCDLQVEVKDDGIGMSEDDLKNIFEAYYQGVVSNRVQNLGMGLGLNLCKELVELFEGDIKVVSAIDKGTTVSFNVLLEKFEKSA